MRGPIPRDEQKAGDGIMTVLVYFYVSWLAWHNGHPIAVAVAWMSCTALNVYQSWKSSR